MIEGDVIVGKKYWLVSMRFIGEKLRSDSKIVQVKAEVLTNGALGLFFQDQIEIEKTILFPSISLKRLMFESREEAVEHWNSVLRSKMDLSDYKISKRQRLLSRYLDRYDTP